MTTTRYRTLPNTVPNNRTVNNSVRIWYSVPYRTHTHTYIYVCVFGNGTTGAVCCLDLDIDIGGVRTVTIR
jgi:hypothetical protein